MEQLTTTTTAVKNAHKEADPSVKKLLENLFPSAFDVKQLKDYKDIKTFADACLVVGTTEAKFNIESEEAGDTPDERAYKQLKLIARALNAGWEPDWNNSNEYKWSPFFDMRSTSGFGFADSLCVYVYSCTHLGSRLCFKSEAIAKHAGENFTAIYKEFLTLNK